MASPTQAILIISTGIIHITGITDTRIADAEYRASRNRQCAVRSQDVPAAEITIDS